MSQDKIYKKIKRHNGERFAQTIRNHHDGLMDLPDLDRIVRHAGHSEEDARAILPYLMGQLMEHLAANENNVEETFPQAPRNPFELLKEAGYDAFHADTLEKQNSIKKHFRRGELLCTFNDAARYQDYHIVHAVHRDAAALRRNAFNGKEERQDEYGTSVVSIQMLKTGGFISIKNRYNHTVAGCDNTFNSNPDNIIDGLSDALKAHFNVEFQANKTELPEKVTLVDGQLFKYHREQNNIYYGDQAWIENGKINEVNKTAGDALFETFLFDNKTKTLKKIDPKNEDSFADDFNRDYRDHNSDLNHGRKDLNIRQGDLYLGDELLIGAKASRMVTLNLPELTKMSNNCLANVRALTSFTAQDCTTMDNQCLMYAMALTSCTFPKLQQMGHFCLYGTRNLGSFDAPELESIGNQCFLHEKRLTSFNTLQLRITGSTGLSYTHNLGSFNAPLLQNKPPYLRKYSPRLVKNRLKMRLGFGPK